LNKNYSSTKLEHSLSLQQKLLAGWWWYVEQKEFDCN